MASNKMGEPGSSIHLSHTLSDSPPYTTGSGEYPRTPLKQRNQRLPEIRATRRGLLSGIWLIIGALGLFTLPYLVPIWWAIGFFYSMFVLCLVDVVRSAKAAERIDKAMKCRGCGSERVKTPFCQWCGMDDPLGDYWEEGQGGGPREVEKSK